MNKSRMKSSEYMTGEVYTVVRTGNRQGHTWLCERDPLLPRPVRLPVLMLLRACRLPLLAAAATRSA